MTANIIAGGAAALVLIAGLVTGIVVKKKVEFYDYDHEYESLFSE